MPITIRTIGWSDHVGGTPDTWDVYEDDTYLGTVELNPPENRYLPYLGSGEWLPATNTLTGAVDVIVGSLT